MSPLFWQLAKNCGLYDDLLTTFTNHKLCAKILVVAIYFIVIGDNNARHISNFTETHFLPENIKLTGQLLSEFYKELSQENQFFANRFFIEGAKRIIDVDINKTIDIYNNKYDINSVLHCTKSMQIHRNPISGECFFLHPSTKQHEIAKALGCDGLFMRKFKY